MLPLRSCLLGHHLEPVATALVLYPPAHLQTGASQAHASHCLHTTTTSSSPSKAAFTSNQQQDQLPKVSNRRALSPSLPAELEERSRQRTTKAELIQRSLQPPSSPLLDSVLRQEQNQQQDLDDGMLIAQHQAAGAGLLHRMDDRKVVFARLLRRHNYSLSQLQGQVVQARVLRLTPSEVYVDAGLHSISPLPRSEIDIGHVINPAPTAPLSERSSLRDLHVGDVIKVAIEEKYTPYGDMQLAPVQQDPNLKRRVVWEELSAAAASGATVQGRVLNQCPGGYAVGVSGFVALLPYAQATTGVSQKVGALSTFYISSITDKAQRLVLRDASLGPPPARKRSAAVEEQV